jgi:hypothetical protein
VTQISLLKGCYADSNANYRASYPVNLEPVITDTGLAKGFLRAAPGITTLYPAPLGPDRGAIDWLGFCYRVMGEQLTRFEGATPIYCDSVGFGPQVSMDFSSDYLAIASNLRLYLYNGVTATQVTDPDLGDVIDVCWIDGYFMTTDGFYLVVTDLTDPFSVNPTKYGSSEADPDPIIALKKVRNEIYALNSNTIENFQNVGGSGFPFRRNPGGLIPKGCVSTHACCYFLESFAFVGSGRNEALSVYLAGNGAAISLSTEEVDRELALLTADEQAELLVEARTDLDEQRLLIHLPDKTLVYFHQASLANESPVWAFLAGGIEANEAYPGRSFVLSQGRWICGTADGYVGYLDETVETQFEEAVGWRFDTTLLWSGGRGGIVKTVELFGLPGRGPTAAYTGGAPTMFLSWTQDGQTYSQEYAISMGTLGQRLKRMQWRPKVRFGNYLGMRFRGASGALASFTRLEAEIEALSV